MTVDIERAYEIAKGLFAADPDRGTYSIEDDHHVEHRNRSLAEALSLLPDPLDSLAPVEASETGAAAYILAEGLIAKVVADFGIRGDDANPPTLTVSSALLTTQSSVRLQHSRLQSKRRRRWTFDVGLDSPIELETDITGDGPSEPNVERFAQALAGEIGWASGRRARPREPLVQFGAG